MEFVFGLQGGHIQPVRDHMVRAGIRIIDVRDERPAVHMAHAYGELTGRLGVADGGDLLSFAGIGPQSRTCLDAGILGCLGVGVPFAVAAALVHPDGQVISVNGDGAHGINAMEIDTAVRHCAGAVFIVSNNAAWNIERYDQEGNCGGRIVGTMLSHRDYAAMACALGAHGERVRTRRT